MLKEEKKRKKHLKKSYDKTGMTTKAIQKLHKEMGWEAMHYAMTEERIGFVLGRITIDELRDSYEPSGWHKYDGIKGEMQNLKFDK